MSRNITILMVGAMLSLAIFFGLRGKEGGVSPPSPEVAKKDNPEVLGVAKEVSVSIDDDAVLGDKEKAKVEAEKAAAAPKAEKATEEK